MAASNLPVLSVVSQRRKKSARKPQSAVTTIPSSDWLDFIDEDEATTAIQRLCEASRGVALVLESLSEHDVLEDTYVLCGLARALKIAVDKVSCEYFRLPGELATTLDPKLLSGLLARQIEHLKGGK